MFTTFHPNSNSTVYKNKGEKEKETKRKFKLHKKLQVTKHTLYNVQ